MSTIKLDTREMDRIIKTSGLKARQVVNRLAFKVEGKAKQMVTSWPAVDTGNMLNSLFTEPTESDNEPAIVGFENVDYAIHVEFGTHKMRARPSLSMAVEGMSHEFNAGESWEEVVK